MPVEVKIEGTKELTGALVEMFSPVTNLLGTLGDRVRIYRQLSLMRSLKRAREIAEEEGFALVEPPMKFLVPFLEDCSLEAPDEDQLIDMWAKLLTSAANEFKSEHNLFIRVLRELSASEAKLLEYLVSPDTHQHFKGYWELEDGAFDWCDSFVYIKLRDVINRLDSYLNDSTPFDQIENWFKEEAESPGCIVYYFSIGTGERGVYPIQDVHNSKRGPIDDDFPRSSIAILKTLGIIGDYTSPEFWFGDYVFQAYTYYITELGAHFIKACTRLQTRGEQGVS